MEIKNYEKLGYAIYLNYFREDTKDVIKGTSIGMQYEWMCHNIAFYGLSFAQLFGANVEAEKGQAQDVNVGATIFADNHDVYTTLMTTSYFLLRPIGWLIDYSISNGGI